MFRQIALLLLSAATAAAAGPPAIEAGVPVFADHDRVYYRLPSVLVTSRGTVLAACQKRLGNSGDFAPSALVLRRSVDGGRSFGPEQTLYGHPGDCTFNGNLVEDRSTGTLFACFIAFPEAERTTWFGKTWIPRGGGFSYVKSTDDGMTWSDPVNVIPLPNADGWRGGGAFNNNHGIQLREGPHAGRLVIAARVFKPGVLETRSKGGLIYSDDDGATWRVGGVMLASYGAINGEVSVGEAPAGEVYVNSRNETGRRGGMASSPGGVPPGIIPHERIYSRSRDGGESFYAEGCHPELFDGPCNAGQTWVPDRASADGGFMFFTAPAVSQRTRLTGYVSRDGGSTWARAGTISERSGGYSDDAALSNGTILTVYENGRDDSRPRGLLLARFNLAGLTGVSAPIRVACLGDSITFGARAADPASQSYPAQLQIVLGAGFIVKNFGVSGATMWHGGPKNAFQQLPAAAKFAPQIVIVMFGINDTRTDSSNYWSHFPGFGPDAERLLDAVLAEPSHPQVLLCLPTSSAPNLPGLTADRIQVLRDRIPRLAAVRETLAAVARRDASRGVELVDLDPTLAPHPELHSADAVHFTAAGYRFIAEALSPRVLAASGTPRSPRNASLITK